jgi:hypothetical protein
VTRLPITGCESSTLPTHSYDTPCHFPSPLRLCVPAEMVFEF